MNQVRLHREAEDDLVEARNWYRARSEVAAQAFVIEIEHAYAASRKPRCGGHAA
jgi:plasmid stabilization system protein ParE